MEINFPQLEKKILRFWKKNQIFEKSVAKKAKDFVFYEGPPTANAPPGLHHVLSRVFKDIVCRYKTMRGYRVIRKAGWDTHGLPVELQIEKKLGLKTKKDIEKYGIARFNQECKKSVWEFTKTWEKLTERIAFWLDLKNPYITYEPEYIESLWFILKEFWKKKLLYQDLKVVPYCPRCQTPLSSHEVAQGYKRIQEPAIYVKLQVLNPDFKNNFLLVWTTTPWTLPGNVAVAVNPEFSYCQIEQGNEFLILAKERIKQLKIEGKIVKEFKGKEIVGLKYQPPFDFYSPQLEKERIWEILPADFVSLEEGTGLVHIAPAFGEEDMELIRNENLKTKNKEKKEFPIILNVDEEGKFKAEVKNWSGMFVKEADPLIIEELKKKGILWKEEKYEHDYPFCWRCKTPLLYYAKKSWFIRVSQLKKEIIKNNNKINWIPSFIGQGRFGEWLKELKDWALSRNRYWGTPLPVWQCQKCSYQEVIGSKEDLRKQKFSKNRYFILRHGESVLNVKGILGTDYPEKNYCPLTEKGKKQIQRVAEKLAKEKIDLIFSSDLLRTKQTAEIVAQKTGAKIIFDKRLRDIKTGIFDGRPKKEYDAFWQGKPYSDFYEKKPKGGESYNEVKKRMLNFIDEIERKYQGKNILIISHQRPLEMLEGALCGYSIKEFAKYVEPRIIEMGELRKIEYKKFPYNEKGELDFHRPYVDEVKFFCPKCGGLMIRVPEVIDCWFDSGAMPFAQYHWPFEKAKIKNGKLLPPDLFPADYIAEGVDQTRGWFYTLLVISSLLGYGPSYKNVISLGHILDEKGEKMSKSKGNVIDPFYIVEKYGTDATRWYFFTINQPWDPKLFSERDIQETIRKFLLTFWNCFLFYKTYALSSPPKQIKSKNVLDRWILSRLNNLILETTQLFEKYEITKTARLIENFVIEDLSLWYIRRSRKRFQISENKKELKIASSVLGYVLLTVAKLSAPFIPFLAEHIYQTINKNPKSVHLEKWPQADNKFIDRKLEKKMEKVQKIVSEALAERTKAKIKVRQPLPKLEIKNKELKKEFELLELIKEEVNVKEIVFGKELKLDTTITPQLKEEGILREFIRQVQQKRKENQFKPTQKIKISVFASEDLRKILEKNKEKLLKEGKIKELVFEEELASAISTTIKVEEKEIKIYLQKI